MFPYISGNLFSRVKENRERFLTFDNKLKGMTTVGGYNYVNTTNDKAKRELNSYYDIAIQKAETEYNLSIKNSNPETPESQLYKTERYEIYMSKLNAIALERQKSLDRIEQDYNSIIKVYSPYWARNAQ
jgi:hypothetical protein